MNQKIDFNNTRLDSRVIPSFNPNTLNIQRVLQDQEAHQRFRDETVLATYVKPYQAYTSFNNSLPSNKFSQVDTTPIPADALNDGYYKTLRHGAHSEANYIIGQTILINSILKDGDWKTAEYHLGRPLTDEEKTNRSISGYRDDRVDTINKFMQAKDWKKAEAWLGRKLTAQEKTDGKVEDGYKDPSYTHYWRPPNGYGVPPLFPQQEVRGLVNSSINVNNIVDDEDNNIAAPAGRWVWGRRRLPSQQFFDNDDDNNDDGGGDEYKNNYDRAYPDLNGVVPSAPPLEEVFDNVYPDLNNNIPSAPDYSNLIEDLRNLPPPPYEIKSNNDLLNSIRAGSKLKQTVKNNKQDDLLSSIRKGAKLRKVSRPSSRRSSISNNNMLSVIQANPRFQSIANNSNIRDDNNDSWSDEDNKVSKPGLLRRVGNTLANAYGAVNRLFEDSQETKQQKAYEAQRREILAEEAKQRFTSDNWNFDNGDPSNEEKGGDSNFFFMERPQQNRVLAKMRIKPTRTQISNLNMNVANNNFTNDNNDRSKSKERRSSISNNKPLPVIKQNNNTMSQADHNALVKEAILAQQNHEINNTKGWNETPHHISLNHATRPRPSARRHPARSNRTPQNYSTPKKVEHKEHGPYSGHGNKRKRSRSRKAKFHGSGLKSVNLDDYDLDDYDLDEDEDEDDEEEPIEDEKEIKSEHPFGKKVIPSLKKNKLGRYQVLRNDQAFGIFYIDIDKLQHENILSLIRQTTRTKINGYPNQKVSDEMKLALMQLMEDVYPDFNSLTANEQLVLKDLIKRSKLNISRIKQPEIKKETVSNKNKPTKPAKSKVQHQLELWLGAIRSGVNSKELKMKIRTLLKQMYKDRMITKEKILQISKAFKLN